MDFPRGFLLNLLTVLVGSLLMALAFAQGFPAGAAPGWAHHSTTITSPFYTAWTHHQGCGREPSGPITRGYYGAYHQRFPHCSFTFSRVFVIHDGAPKEPTPTAVVVTASAVVPTEPPKVPPTPTSTSTAIPTPTTTSTPSVVVLPLPTPQPIATATAPPSNDPATYELSLMNQTRAQYSLPPYSINPLQSMGTASCAGSIGHSLAMAASGFIWHVNASYPAQSFPNNLCVTGITAAGENVGEAFGYSVNGALDVIHQQMMAEPHSPGCQGNHACSILSPVYTQVGIGIDTGNGTTWLTVDFVN